MYLNICPIYNAAWCEMNSKQDEAKMDAEKFQVLLEFALKYTMLPENWLQFAQ